MLQSILLKLLIEAVKNEEIRAFAFDLATKLALRLKDDLLPDLLEAVVPLIPKFIDAGLKQVVELFPDMPNIPESVDLAKGVAEKVIATDPDIPGLSDIVDLSEILRGFLR
ncbi:hypothetical protein NIIDNTM18_42070 [Mycolicibacterium litorale]|uniref:Uncharacterized protein n=1 Tax=Mycolicibacterium litorale TaxID=758802 RepID=A0A6S6P944_9MYCO|nr:hypothetical protein [Mycolicibacterium litorale]BCI54929.1 hypothetical protein NIIDNTM18_42070 [Mycolicibacterium litorale]